MDGTFPLPPRLPVARRRAPPVPSAVLATLIFVCTEVMLFAGMISAFTITRANQPLGLWPPPGQPRLPAEATALNTLALLASGALLLAAYLRWRRGEDARRAAALTRWLYWGAWCLGAAFVALQGREWRALLEEGLTLRSSLLGAFFYLIVGGHALHALCALVFLAVGGVRLWRGEMPRGWFFGSQVFWYFVVLMWPIIYLRVYF